MKSTSQPIRDQVFHTLGTHLNRDPERLHPEDHLRDDLGLDSLQTIELIYEVESAFDIQIPDEDFGQIQTIGDVVNYLTRRTSNPEQSPGPTKASQVQEESSKVKATKTTPSKTKSPGAQSPKSQSPKRTTSGTRKKRTT